MKKSLVLPCLLLTVVAGTASADEALQDWKCYLQLESGSMHIAYYTVSPQGNQAVDQQLASTPVFADNGVTKLQVKKLLECQLEESEFKDPDANALELRIPK